MDCCVDGGGQQGSEMPESAVPKKSGLLPPLWPEEMAGLCAPWGPPPNRDPRDALRSTIRTHYLSTMELNQVGSDSLHSKQHIQQTFTESVGKVRRRSPSLPPIYTRSSQSGQEEEENSRVHDAEDEGETETSGYASESGGNDTRQGDFWQQQQHAASWVSDHQRDQSQSRQQQQHQQQQHLVRRPPTYNRGYATPDSMISTPPHRWSYVSSDESNRPRWGDRGVGVGHLWEPTFHEPDCRLPQVQGSDRGTPSWLERGLSKLGDSQVLVINHSTEPSTNLSCSLGGSCDTINTVNTQIHSDGGRTFLRGQNVPLEPDVLLERERKRQKALEHQNAIRQQLEERDRKRKEERERRAREEREEEERIKREQEREQQRLEEEFRKQKEREEKEARKAKAMREALENAQKLAKQEKMKARTKYIVECKGQKDKDNEVASKNNVNIRIVDDSTTNWPQNHSLQPDIISTELQLTSSLSCNSLEKKSGGIIVTPIKQEQSLRSPTNSTSDIIYTDTLAVPADGLAVVLGAAQTADGSLVAQDILPAAGNAVQLALLMSPAASLAPQSLMVENRVLTPSRYRHHARGTQTDTELLETGRIGRSKSKRDTTHFARERKKSASLDRLHRGCKLPLRCRSQSQPNQQRLSIEDRPKWGVNRPPTQYIKQSEKDPYYQRRLRQRLLRAAMLAGANGSSGFSSSGGGGGSGSVGGGAVASVRGIVVSGETESDSYPRRRQQRFRQGSSEENSRSPSPQQNPYPTSNKNLFYHQQPSKFIDRTVSDKPDISVISLDLSTFDSVENNHTFDGKRRDSLSKSHNYQNGTPSKRVQVLVSSENTPRKYSDTPVRRKSNVNLSSVHINAKNSNKGYSQRLLQRKTEPQIMLDTKAHISNDQWTNQDILSQLTTLRQGLLIKQQEWETRRSQTPYSEGSWQP